MAWNMGFLAGAMIAVVIVVILIIKGKKGTKAVYDERQTLARNVAYKYAFSALLLYSAVCALLDMFEIRWALTYMILYIGIFLGIGVFAIVCILKDAYSGLHDNRRSTIFVLLFIGVLNLIVFVSNRIGGKPMLTDGLLNEQLMQLLLGLLFLFVGTAMLIRDRVNRKTEDEE